MGPATESGEPPPVSDGEDPAAAIGPVDETEGAVAPETVQDESQPAASEAPPAEAITPATEPR
jgi:hypothetical protein